MTYKRQINLSIETSFVLSSPEGLGARYANAERDMPKRKAIAMLLRHLAPLEAAISGMSRSEVEALITASDRLHSLLMEQARAAIVDTAIVLPETKKGEAIVRTAEDAEEDFGGLFGDD